MKKTLTIAIVPWHEPGHINATIRLGAELIERGHHVKYVTKPEHERLFVERRLPFVHMDVPKDPTAKNLTVDLHGFSPDLLLVDPVFCEEPLLFWRSGLAVVKLSSVFPMRFDSTVPPLCSPLMPPCDELSQRLVDAAWEAWHARNLKCDWTDRHWQWARALGFPDDRIDERSSPGPTSRFPEVALVPEELDFPRREREAVFYTGPAVDLSRQETHEFPFDWLRDDRPLVYCSFGTQVHRYTRLPEHLNTLCEAARQHPDLQFVIAAGMDHEAQTPTNVRLARAAPQLALLRRASLMISHGGLNGIKETLCLGVPVLVLPFDMDQPGNAARLAYHRYGEKADWETVTASELSNLIRRTLHNEELRSRTEALGERLRLAIKEQRAARAVEECWARLNTA